MRIKTSFQADCGTCPTGRKHVNYKQSAPLLIVCALAWHFFRTVDSGLSNNRTVQDNWLATQCIEQIPSMSASTFYLPFVGWCGLWVDFHIKWPFRLWFYLSPLDTFNFECVRCSCCQPLKLIERMMGEWFVLAFVAAFLLRRKIDAIGFKCYVGMMCHTMLCFVGSIEK